MSFSKTAKQKEQVRLMSGPHKHVMSYGGSRSGKTFGICRAMIIRAAKVPSRHVALRLNFNHAKTALFMDTFPRVFELCFPDLQVKEDRSDWLYKFPNGSEIWIGGLDEKKRVEKILGKEYSTIFFNECSQIPWSSVSVALTRLAQKNELKKKAYYDENPPTKRHWSYPLFIKGLDPETWEPRTDTHNYGSILMNPEDNIENIDEDYITGILDQLPEKAQKRFRDGVFTDDSNGNIYHAFNREKHCKKLKRNNEAPLIIGMDFNVNPMTASIIQIYDDTVHVIDEIYIENSNTPEMVEVIQQRFPGRHKVIADSTGGNRTTTGPLSNLQHLKNGGLIVPAFRNPFREDRYAAVNDLFSKDRLIIDPKCVKLIRDLEQVAYKEGTNLPDTTEKHLTHCTDNLGYVCHWAYPVVKIETTASNITR